jgi:ABC-type sugar transport system permease subunit
MGRMPWQNDHVLVTSSIEKRTKKRKGLKDRKRFAGILFILPAFLFIFSFMLYPLVYSFYMSLHKYNFVYDKTPVFKGLQNYTKAFQDENFIAALKNTFTYGSIYFVAIMLISLGLALSLFHIKLFNSFFRTIIFLPIVVPVSLTALVFLWILQENYGLLNYLLRDEMGLASLALPWLNKDTTAMGSIIAVGLWATIGFETILFLGGLQSIPKDILEAAEVDGANGWKRIIYIILPNLRETYILTGIWAILHGLKVFVEPMVMTNGGPGNSTLVLYQEVYSTAFSTFDMGYASAMAYILGVITLVFALLNFWINRSKDHV